jgi:hypothetical protein
VARAGGAVALALGSETPVSSLFEAIVPGAVVLVNGDACGEGAIAQSDSFDSGVLGSSERRDSRCHSARACRVRHAL